VERARRIIAEEIIRHPLFLDTRTDEQKQGGEPAVNVLCTGLGDFSVNLRAAVWTADRGAGYRMLCELRLSVKRALTPRACRFPIPIGRSS
jgi:small-conductance mechanosensitive channel